MHAIKVHGAVSVLFGVPAWEGKCQAFGDVYREVPHHRCCLGTLDPSEPFEGLCGNGRLYLSGFCAPRTKGLYGLACLYTCTWVCIFCGSRRLCPGWRSPCV